MVAAAVCFLAPPSTGLASLLDDSKRLSARARERAFSALRAARNEGLVVFGIGAASAAEIGRLNILRASLLAMRRAVARLHPPPDLVLVDGTTPPELSCAVLCLAGGDRISLSIAAASILAKVLRDRAIERLAARWPQYGWQMNRGYPTPAHRDALERCGASPHHRRGFAPVDAALSRH